MFINQAVFPNSTNKHQHFFIMYSSFTILGYSTNSLLNNIGIKVPLLPIKETRFIFVLLFNTRFILTNKYQLSKTIQKL